VGAGLLVPVAGLDSQGECGGVVGSCLFGLPGGVQSLADAVEREEFSLTVANVTRYREGLLVKVDGLLVAAQSPIDEAEVTQHVGLVFTVADVAADGEGLLVVADGLLVTALPPVGKAEVVQRDGFDDL
jgi:hypothetical protein